MDLRQLESDVLGFVRRGYPGIDVRVEAWEADPKRAAIYFTDSQFAVLYPAQRYPYLRNLIPADYYDRHLTDSERFEVDARGLGRLATVTIGMPEESYWHEGSTTTSCSMSSTS